MSLVVWLPLTKDTRNQGLVNISSSNNGVTFTNGGKLGEKYFSAGTITIPASSSNSIFNGTHMSFSFWLKPVGTSGTNVIFGQSSMSAGNNRMYSIFQYPTPNDLHISWQSETSSSTFIGFTISGFFEADKWTHCALVYDGSKLLVYKNGVLNGTYNGANTRTAFNYDYPINASSIRCLNDFRIYDHCLSPMEVKELAKGLVLHYPLNRQGWGQENLYTGSRDFSGTWVNGSAWTTSTETYEGFTVKERSATWGGLAQNVTATNGDIFTISFYAKVASGGRIVSIHRSNLGNVTTGLSILGGNFIAGTTDWVGTTTDGTQWNRYWATVQIVSSDITYLQWRIENSVADKKLQVCGMKLEKGSIATPWCPNSSDTLATTMGLNSTTEYDCSGFCNNGEKIGTLTYTSDTPKYAVSTHIGSTSSKIHISNFPTSGFGNSYSFAWWGKNTTFSNKMFWGFSDGIRLNGMYSGVLWNTGDSSNNPLYKINTTTQVSAPSVNTWHHYVMTGNGTKCYVYLDGELWAEAKTYKAISGTSIYINGWGNTTDYCYDNMDISDFRIYATALSADDVKSLYQNCATIDPDGTIRGQIRS